MASFFSKLFSGDTERRLRAFANRVNAEEPALISLSNEELKRASEELRIKVRKGCLPAQAGLSDLPDRQAGGQESSNSPRTEGDPKAMLEEQLPRAFALVREAAKRNLGQRHFDVQLMGGLVLHEGRIAEMLTGEGKTLAATLPAYANALLGQGVHVVTVNDYLAKRDAVWMGQIYHALGLSVSCIVHDAAYRYDPTYTEEKYEILNPPALGKPLARPGKSETNSKFENQNEKKNELDKARDQLGSFKVFEEFLRPITRREAYAADITYGTNHEFGFDYLRDNLALRLGDKVQVRVNPHLHQHESASDNQNKSASDNQCESMLHYTIIDEVDSILIDEARTPLIIAAPDVASSEYYKTFARVVDRLKPDEDYTVDEKFHSVNILEPGIEKTEKMVGLQNIFAPENARLVHYLQESLKAKALFHEDKHYIVENGEIIIIDEFTGRKMYGRRYSGGLHQAIEAKAQEEGKNVKVQQESRTYAQITIQNYFRLYQKIAGMTGTAQTSAEEFHKVYNLDVVSIPPNKPMVRSDASDIIYKTKEARYRAVVQDVKARHEKGQPILLGTTSITNNEILSSYLTQSGIPHEVLNAKNNEREGAIIAQAGRRGAVTVATNMAGRGVDIVLGGNPPSPDEAKEVCEVGGLHVIGTERHEARRIDNQLRGRSGRQGDPGSSQFFLSLEDDLLRVFGGDRIKHLMETMNLPEDLPIESGMVSKAVNQAQQKVEGANFDIRKHLLDFDDVLNKQRTAMYKRREKILEAGERGEALPLVQETLTYYAEAREAELRRAPDEKTEKAVEELKQQLAKVPQALERERSVMISQHLVRILDTLWIDHLENLEGLRDTVNLRAYGQHEPLVEYRREAHFLYQQLNAQFESLLFMTVFPLFEIDMAKVKAAEERRTPPPPEAKHIGRNDPCWCGAKDPKTGKPIKYKRCHGR